jgi:hypothetical protein
MASVWVILRPGVPLGGGFPAEQFLLQRGFEIDRRSSSPERHLQEGWLRQTARQNEDPPAEFYCSLEEGCSGESCYGIDQISEENFRRYSRDTQSTLWVLIRCSLALFISRRAKSNAA